jgi:hypothetical protein
MNGLVSLFLEILFTCVVCGLFYWVIGALGTPDPMGRIARVAIIFIGSLVLLFLVFGHFGVGFHHLAL